MEPRVLIVSGGLVTSQESSLTGAARRLFLQSLHARHAWLDRKVKCVAAEPILGMALEKMALPFRSRATRHAFSAPPKPSGNLTTPSLTEVLLATLLDRAGMPWDGLSLDRLFSQPREAERLLRRANCIFLSSTYLHDLSELELIVTRLKRSHNRVVLGGALAAAIHEQWEGMEGIDVVAIGYGEFLVDSLVQWIRSGFMELSPPPSGSLTRRRHSRFIHGGAPESMNLDSLPAPDWKLAQQRLGAPLSMIYYESVRGCPYRCSFCNYPFLFADTKFRTRSARQMADDWEHYVGGLGVEYITCLDSLFTMPRQRLHEFCRILIERRIRVKWVCYARADDLADAATVELMRRAGAHQVQIGIESGDPLLLQNMNKACTVQANRQALLNCRKLGLTSIVSLIVGYPGETQATLQRTFEFLKSSPPDFYFLATFSTRIAGVPLLRPENRRRFGLRVMENLRSMAPYWEHDTMSCADVGNHVRHLDKLLMRERVALNATLFYAGLLEWKPEDRESLLNFQQNAAARHPMLESVFNLINGWVDRKLKRDVERHFNPKSSIPIRDEAILQK